MEETNALSVAGPEQGVLEVRQQVNQLQYLMQAVLKEGEHYGVVPGTKGKPTLFQSGAEKIAQMFHLIPTFKVERTDFNGGHREYQVTCELTSLDAGRVVGYGLGSCSTLESKYRYRSRWVNGSKVKEENADIADTWNTVLKIAKKRAFVDAVKSTTAASDIFTQDVEDLPAYMLDRTPRSQPVQATVEQVEPQKPTEKELEYLRFATNALVEAGYVLDEVKPYIWETFKQKGMGAVEKELAQMLENAKQAEPEPEPMPTFKDEKPASEPKDFALDNKSNMWDSIKNEPEPEPSASDEEMDVPPSLRERFRKKKKD